MQTNNHNWQAGAGATAPAPIPPNQASKQTSTPPARPGPAFFPLPNPPASPPLSPSTPTPGPYFANDHLARRAGAPVCPGLGVKACSGNGIHLIQKMIEGEFCLARRNTSRTMRGPCRRVARQAGVGTPLHHGAVVVRWCSADWRQWQAQPSAHCHRTAPVPGSFPDRHTRHAPPPGPSAHIQSTRPPFFPTTSAPPC